MDQRRTLTLRITPGRAALALLVTVFLVSLAASALDSYEVTVTYREMTPAEQTAAQVSGCCGYDQARATWVPVFVSAPGAPCRAIDGYEYQCDVPHDLTRQAGITLDSVVRALFSGLVAGGGAWLLLSLARRWPRVRVVFRDLPDRDEPD